MCPILSSWVSSSVVLIVPHICFRDHPLLTPSYHINFHFCLLLIHCHRHSTPPPCFGWAYESICVSSHRQTILIQQQWLIPPLMTSLCASRYAAIIAAAIRGWGGGIFTAARSTLFLRRKEILSNSSRSYSYPFYLHYCPVFLYLISLLLRCSPCIRINIRSVITAGPKHEVETAITISWQENPLNTLHPLPPILMDSPLPPLLLFPCPPSYTFMSNPLPVSPSHNFSATYAPPPHDLPSIFLHRSFFFLVPISLHVELLVFQYSWLQIWSALVFIQLAFYSVPFRSYDLLLLPLSSYLALIYSQHIYCSWSTLTRSDHMLRSTFDPICTLLVLVLTKFGVISLLGLALFFSLSLGPSNFHF